MIAPALLFGKAKAVVEVIGGTDVKWSLPSFAQFALCKHVLPKMGINIDYKVLKGGYYPRGNGQVKITTTPLSTPIQPITLKGQKSKIHTVYLNVITRNDNPYEKTFGV